MAVCPVKDKKRVTLLHVLSVLVLLLLFGVIQMMISEDR